MFKKIILIPVILILLALDWAALHDILKGEQNLLAEYGMLLLSMIIFTVILIAGSKKRHINI
jgi:hypothetical protein